MDGTRRHGGTEAHRREGNDSHAARATLGLIRGDLEVDSSRLAARSSTAFADGRHGGMEGRIWGDTRKHGRVRGASAGGDTVSIDDSLTERIIGCAIEVHRELGPGLLESTYDRALRIELSNASLRFACNVRVPVRYKGHLIGEYRPDLVVEHRVVVEIKSVERLVGVHQAQLLAYMRALRLPVGLLLNFYTDVLRTGIKRAVL
jgi:GxxExxY protein